MPSGFKTGIFAIYIYIYLFRKIIYIYSPYKPSMLSHQCRTSVAPAVIPKT